MVDWVEGRTFKFNKKRIKLKLINYCRGTNVFYSPLNNKPMSFLICRSKLCVLNMIKYCDKDGVGDEIRS